MAFLLDTNVISELRKGSKARPEVITWRRSIAYAETFISVLVLGEMRRGVMLNSEADPSSGIIFEKWLNEVITVYRERILDVNKEICDVWGRIAAGMNIPIMDGLIAATAAHHDLTVVTRNTRDFQRCGVDFINPFEA